MALIFPRPMPDSVSAQSFELDQVDYSTSVADGRQNGVSAGWPKWQGRWTLSDISVAATNEWRAFLASLRGQRRPFLGFDAARRFPLMYPTGFAGMARASGGAFAGASTSWSINADGDVLTATGLPAGLVLSLNDYGMLRWTTGGDERRSLHRVVEAATASGGGVVALTIEPPVPTLVPGTAVFDLAEPCCVMKLTGETSLGAMTRSRRLSGEVVAIQDLRP